MNEGQSGRKAERDTRILPVMVGSEPGSDALLPGKASHNEWGSAGEGWSVRWGEDVVAEVNASLQEPVRSSGMQASCGVFSRWSILKNE